MKLSFPLKIRSYSWLTWPITYRHLREFLCPIGYCTHWIANFTGPAAASSKFMKADTPEPLHYIYSPENGFYNLKDSPVIINLSFHLYIETSFAEWNLTRKWTSETRCLLYLHIDFMAKACPPVCTQRQQVKVDRGLAELVLGSPLTPMVCLTIQTLLLTENTEPFSVSRLTFFEIL